MIVEVEFNRPGTFYEEEHVIGKTFPVFELNGVYVVYPCVGFTPMVGLHIFKEDCKVISNG